MAKMTLMTDEWLAEMKRTVILWRDEGYRPPLIVTEKLIAEVVRLLDEQDAWRTAVAEHEENAKKWKAEVERLLALLDEALDLAEEGIGYTAQYFVDKHYMAAQHEHLKRGILWDEWNEERRKATAT